MVKHPWSDWYSFGARMHDVDCFLFVFFWGALLFCFIGVRVFVCLFTTLVLCSKLHARFFGRGVPWMLLYVRVICIAIVYTGCWVYAHQRSIWGGNYLVLGI